MNWLDLDFNLPKLGGGCHEEGSDVLCAMEMVAFIERLPPTDRPKCTEKFIADLVITTNDYADDVQRQRLWDYLPRVIGTENIDPNAAHERAVCKLFNQVIPLICPLHVSIQTECKAVTDYASAAEAADLLEHCKFCTGAHRVIDPTEFMAWIPVVIDDLVLYYGNNTNEQKIDCYLSLLDAALGTQPAKQIDIERIRERVTA